jgi:hypothetical protein
VNAPALHGPIATADALQTLKPRRRFYERIVLSLEIGPRAFGHVTETPTCTHRVKAQTRPAVWQCVADSHNTRVPGCGALFTVAYGLHGQPTWAPAGVTR